MTECLIEIRGDATQSPAQYMEALRADESALADFHELRQDFNPPKWGKP
jgi:hypothetical protein